MTQGAMMKNQSVWMNWCLWQIPMTRWLVSENADLIIFTNIHPKMIKELFGNTAEACLKRIYRWLFFCAGCRRWHYPDYSGRNFGQKDAGGMHCFSSSTKMGHEAIDLGFSYFFPAYWRLKNQKTYVILQRRSFGSIVSGNRFPYLAPRTIQRSHESTL